VSTTQGFTRTPLIGLLVGHTVSMTGNMLTIIALPLYVLAETGSAAATGVTGFIATLPIVLGGVFGGVLVDRVGYRRASVVADLVSGATIVLVPVLDITVGLPFPVLLGLVFLSGLLDTPGQGARNALLPEVAAAAGVPLERAVGMFEATERGARMAGAPLAGLLVALFGALPVLALDAATFVLSAAVLARLVPGDMDARMRADRESSEVSSYWRSLREGFHFVAREPLLRAFVVLVFLTNAIDAAKSTVLLPVYAERELGGAVAFGLLVGTMGGGALLGSLVFGAIGHRLPRRPTFALAFALAGAPPSLSLAAGLPLPVLLGITAASGFCAGAINPLMGTVKLERIPPDMRARANGLIQAGAWAAVPLGALGAGFAVEKLGLTETLLALGLIYLALTLSPLLGGPWRELDERRPTPMSGATEASVSKA
jgi:MFS family permease